MADPAAVARLRSAGLVAPMEEGGLALSSAGASALRRALAGGDFAAQHRDTRVLPLDEGAGVRPVLVNVAESPIAWLRSRSDKAGKPLIDEAAFAAGERLRADFTRGQMMPRVTANWGATVAQGRRSGDSGGMADIADAALAARLRVDRALAAVGPELAGVLLDVCCFLRGIEEVELTQDWPRRSGKLVLRLALAALARHYGLAATARGGAGAPIRHWGAEDYRPRAD
ncbi:DUF6456 domain-containing protein [Prosthecomicrobium pneumaticum]|uniref:DUF6456 domain-containing protein n=1 Tax=Prosthecomicrobium pneumaticum TaxID=81895 RepID=A0A7W9CU84_9HYPH|nr:DUF6456 domain-containing protein [Prosthecomicrobium pneumaticum]MBB5751711.1 hypothetical protein [Prosthecomicrobium pneumaticum]